MLRLIALAILPFVLSLLPKGTAVPVAQPTRASIWVQTTSADFKTGRLSQLGIEVVEDGELVLAPGAASGTYLSSTKKADFPFNAVGAQWKADLPSGTAVDFDIRSSPDGRQWSEWLPLEELDISPGKGGPASYLVVCSGNYLQYRVTLKTIDASLLPRLKEVTFVYIDSTGGPTLAQATASATMGASTMGESTIAGVSQPSIIPRAGWGADESYRFCSPDDLRICPSICSYVGQEKWPPTYAYTLKAIIHHTVTSNDDPDPAATMRAIYYYHAKTLCWGDIGYNFVIDWFGNIYEGRYGGDNVVAGHALGYNVGSVGIAAMGDYRLVNISAQLERSLVSLLTWECYKHGINPLGYSTFVDKYVANIMGHRDVNNTQCPGDNLYNQLPSIRSQVWSRLPAYGEAWVSHETPTRVDPGVPLRVKVSVRNSGTTTWLCDASSPNPFRLGFHWYKSSGEEYTQQPSLEYHTPLPRDVPSGESVTVDALLNTPNQAGNYILKWDMVRERVTWFSQQGNATLDVAVRVGQEELSYNIVLRDLQKY
jgi:hypothetical protein